MILTDNPNEESHKQILIKPLERACQNWCKMSLKKSVALALGKSRNLKKGPFWNACKIIKS